MRNGRNGPKTRPHRRLTQAELDAFLEKAADLLRGGVDHSEFRGYVFALLFYKRINNVYLESGVCIRFERASLLRAVKHCTGIRSRNVKYLKLEEIRDLRLKTSDLPFLKRFAFEHEAEFRLIYESVDHAHTQLDVEFSLSCIHRVTLSPWMHPSLASHVRNTIRAIKGCGALEVVRSTLIGNMEWKTLGEAAA